MAKRKTIDRAQGFYIEKHRHKTAVELANELHLDEKAVLDYMEKLPPVQKRAEWIDEQGFVRTEGGAVVATEQSSQTGDRAAGNLTGTLPHSKTVFNTRLRDDVIVNKKSS